MDMHEISCGNVEGAMQDRAGVDELPPTLDAEFLESCPSHLVPLLQLRPTQLGVGMQQVRVKEVKIQRADLPEHPKKLDKFLRKVLHRIPAVRGPVPPPQYASTPQTCFYIIDHHHFGLALIRAGVKEAYVAEVQDLSALSWNEFWLHMQATQRVWTHDHRGNLLSLAQFINQLPASLPELQDDPYRSLAALLRKHGGYKKVRVPFSEFIWANYLRKHIVIPLSPGCRPEELDQELVQVHVPAACEIAKAMSAESAAALKLPGK